MKCLKSRRDKAKPRGGRERETFQKRIKDPEYTKQGREREKERERERVCVEFATFLNCQNTQVTTNCGIL